MTPGCGEKTAWGFPWSLKITAILLGSDGWIINDSVASFKGIVRLLIFRILEAHTESGDSDMDIAAMNNLTPRARIDDNDIIFL